MAGHVEKLPTNSKEVPIRSEQRGTVGAKRGEEIMNVASKFNERGDYNGTWYDPMSKEYKQTCKNTKLISEVGKL